MRFIPRLFATLMIFSSFWQTPHSKDHLSLLATEDIVSSQLPYIIVFALFNHIRILAAEIIRHYVEVKAK